MLWDASFESFVAASSGRAGICNSMKQIAEIEMEDLLECCHFHFPESGSFVRVYLAC